jgi:ABC-type lipoprotein export system ATPase subunit
MTALASASVTPAGSDVICAGLVHIYPGEAGPIVALRNLEFVARAGEMLALLGPSGSGKSTLLAVLSGLLKPTAGQAIVAGHDMGRMNGRRLTRLRSTALALLLQDPLENLIPYATVLENLAFAQRGARRVGWRLNWVPEELADLFGLGGMAGRAVYRLSDGEQQRVATACAMATSPQVLVADEPTTNLDTDARNAVIDALKQAHELSGATVIVATHDASTAEAFPRTVTMSHGMIGSEGRGGQQFAVMNRDGALQLPPEVVNLYPGGSLFRVLITEQVVELWPESQAEEQPGPTDADPHEPPFS